MRGAAAATSPMEDRPRESRGRASPPRQPARSRLRARPSSPDTGSVCPTLAFAVPTAIWRAASGASTPRGLSAAASEPASVGSPSAVPVPCASMPQMPCGMSASARAEEMSSRWARPLGAVRLALRPSCRTAEPSKHALEAVPPGCRWRWGGDDACGKGRADAVRMGSQMGSRRCAFAEGAEVGAVEGAPG